MSALNFSKAPKRPTIGLLPLLVAIATWSGSAWSASGDLKWKFAPSQGRVITLFQGLVLDKKGDLYAGAMRYQQSPTLDLQKREYGLISLMGGGALSGSVPHIKWNQSYIQELGESAGGQPNPFASLIIKDDILVAQQYENTLIVAVNKNSGQLLKKIPLPVTAEMRRGPGALGNDGMLFLNRCENDANAIRPILYGVSVAEGKTQWKKQLGHRSSICNQLTFGEYQAFAPVLDATGIAHVSTQLNFWSESIPAGTFHAVTKDGSITDGAELPMRPLQSSMGEEGRVYTLGYKDRPSAKTDYALYATSPDQLSETLLSFTMNFGYFGDWSSEPVISGSSLYSIDSSGDGYRWAMSALDLSAKPVSRRWTFPLTLGDGGSYAERPTSTPAVSAGNTLYLATNQALYAINAETGVPRWKKTEYKGIKDLTIGLDGTLYAVACGDASCVIALEGDGTPLAKGPWPKFRGNLANTGQFLDSTAEDPVEPPIAANVTTSHDTVEGLQTVTLDGRASHTDSEGGLKYRWKQAGGPLLKTRIIGETHSQAAIEIPPVSSATVFNFRLEVTDGEGRTASNNTEVLANPPEIIHPPRFTVSPSAKKSVKGPKRIKLTALLSPLNTLGDPVTSGWSETTTGYKAGIVRDRVRSDQVIATIPRVTEKTTFTFEFTATNSAGTKSEIVTIHVMP